MSRNREESDTVLARTFTNMDRHGSMRDGDEKEGKLESKLSLRRAEGSFLKIMRETGKAKMGRSAEVRTGDREQAKLRLEFERDDRRKENLRRELREEQDKEREREREGSREDKD